MMGKNGNRWVKDRDEWITDLRMVLEGAEDGVLGGLTARRVLHVLADEAPDSIGAMAENGPYAPRQAG